MVIIAGLLILMAAVGVAVAGVATNMGSGHQIGNTFALFGQHPTGLSTGQLFLAGVVVGAVAVVGLSLVLGPLTRRLASRGSRRELKSSRRETTVLRQDRDQLARQLHDEQTEQAGPDAAQEPAPAAEPQPTQPPVAG